MRKKFKFFDSDSLRNIHKRVFFSVIIWGVASVSLYTVALAYLGERVKISELAIYTSFFIIIYETFFIKLDIVAFYEKKPNKISTENFMEIDNQYLESYGDYEEHKEFSQISSKSIGGKTLQEWFEYDGISYWWFVFPSIYPKFNDGVLFVERLQSFLEKIK